MTRVAVVFGGPSPEHDISILTGLHVVHTLAGTGMDVTALYWTTGGDWYEVPARLEAQDYVQGPPKGATPVRLVVGTGGGWVEERRKPRPLGVDVALLCCHGGPGEDGTLQAALDLAGIRYTGPSSIGAALAMDKLAMHALAASLDIPVAEQAPLSATPPPFAGPYIVKPRFGGSSIGVQAVDDHDTALALLRTSVHLRDGAVIEQYLDGWVDLNVAVRTHPEVQCSPIERPLRPEGERIYSFAEKYLGGTGAGMETAPRELPAQLPDGVVAAIVRHATLLAEPARIRGIARIDFLWDGAERVAFNEINAIPGALSLYLWQAAGLSGPQAVGDLVAEALAAPARTFSSAGNTGEALRSAKRKLAI